MSLFVYPPHFTDEQKAERRRLREQEERAEVVKAGLRLAGAAGTTNRQPPFYTESP